MLVETRTRLAKRKGTIPSRLICAPGKKSTRDVKSASKTVAEMVSVRDLFGPPFINGSGISACS